MWLKTIFDEYAEENIVTFNHLNVLEPVYNLRSER